MILDLIFRWWKVNHACPICLKTCLENGLSQSQLFGSQMNFPLVPFGKPFKYFWLNANVSKLLEKLSTLRNLPNKINEFLWIFLEKADIHLTICYLYLFYIVDIFSIFPFCLHQFLCLCYRFFSFFSIFYCFNYTKLISRMNNFVAWAKLRKHI